MLFEVTLFQTKKTEHLMRLGAFWDTICTCFPPFYSSTNSKYAR